MKEKLLKKLQAAGWKYHPTLISMIDSIMENNINISIEMGGCTSWWCVVRDNTRKAIFPVQTGDTIDEAVAKVWLGLNKKHL